MGRWMDGLLRCLQVYLSLTRHYVKFPFPLDVANHVSCQQEVWEGWKVVTVRNASLYVQKNLFTPTLMMFHPKSYIKEFKLSTRNYTFFFFYLCTCMLVFCLVYFCLVHLRLTWKEVHTVAWLNFPSARREFLLPANVQRLHHSFMFIFGIRVSACAWVKTTTYSSSASGTNNGRENAVLLSCYVDAQHFVVKATPWKPKT